MVERSLTVKLETGLQARPAAQFVQEANKFSAEVFLEKGGKQINAKSIMGLMTLALAKDEEIIIKADGDDEEEAITALVAFVTNEA